MWTVVISNRSSSRLLLALVSLLVCPLVQWEVYACPSTCACGRDESIVMCQKGAWTDVEGKLSAKTKHLILDGVTGLETIKANMLLKQQYELKMLKIKHCSVQTIEPLAFANLQVLDELDLSENNLMNLDSDSFAGLSNLRTLSLANNKVSRLEGVLAPLGNLKTLDASHNVLQDLSPSVFKNQSSLLALKLEGNPLKSLPAESFSGLQALQELRLRDCSLQSLDLDVFHSLPKLTTLDLGQNRLSKPLSKAVLTDLTFLSTLLFDHNELQRLVHKEFAGLHLQALDLSYNRITYIEKSAFQNLTLKELDLSDNLILSLSTDFLDPLSEHLTSLSLAGNPVEILDSTVFSNLEHLESLNLSSCRLKFIDHKILKTMPDLHTLDVSHNNLHFLSQDVLSFIDGLTVVNLHQNKWICDCQIKPLCAWLGKSRSLAKLHCPPSRSKYQECTTLRCAAPSQLYHKLLHQIEKEHLGECVEEGDDSDVPASTQGAIVAACLGFAIIFLIITVYLWTRGKTSLKLKRVCVPSDAESSHMIDEDSKVPPLSNCDRASLNESDHEFVVRHYFDTLVTDPKLMSRTSDTEEPRSPKERDSLYSSQPSLYSNPGAAAPALGIESTV